MENLMRFKGKKVIITGASRNTGVGIARLFIREGADVITSGSTAESQQRELNYFGLKVLIIFILILVILGMKNK